MQTNSYECGEATVNGPCKLPPRHRGYHSVVVFTCDNCDRTLRGTPTSFTTDLDGDPVAQFCFMCTKEAERDFMGR